MNNNNKYKYILLLMDILELDDNNRYASGGYQYYILKDLIPDWSYKLHTFGNTLSNKVLETIAVEGIIRWYFNNIKIDIDYNPHIFLDFLDNPQKICFFHIKKIIEFGNIFGIKNDYLKNLKLEDYETKYEFITKNIIDNDSKQFYILKPFGYYICDNCDIKSYLKNIYDEINKRFYFFENGSFFKTFLSKYNKIKSWGIIFQKFKIILEKLACIKHTDIYIIDKFVETIQKYIFTLVIKYSENFMIIETKNITLKNEEIFNCTKYLDKYENICINWKKIISL